MVLILKKVHIFGAIGDKLF